MRVIQQHHKQQSDRVLYGTVGLLVLSTLVTAGVLGASSTHAEILNRVVSSNASVTVSSTCSMTGTVNTPHTETIVNGQKKLGIGQTTLKVLCNDSNGFAVYAIGYTGGDSGVTAHTNTQLQDSASGQAINSTDNNGTPQLDGTISNWAMKLGAVSGTYAPTIMNGYDSANYKKIPASYDRVAERNSSTDIYDSGNNPNPVGSSITTTYAASISPTQVAGTYEGRVKYILVHPYTNTDAAYSNRYMQNVSEWGGTLLVGETTTAVDNRDGKVYTVARLCMKADGSCDTTQNVAGESKLWMVQNLQTDINDPNITFTNQNTNITTNPGAAEGYSTSGSTITWTPSANKAQVVNYAAGSPANSVTGWTNSPSAPYYAVPSDGNEHYMVKGTPYATTAACTSALSADECRPYNIGYYYNFSAAVASNNTSSYQTDKTVMPNSICPAGWRLPNGLTENGGTTNPSEFNQLLTSYGLAGGIDTTGSQNVGWAGGGMNAFESSPFYFARSGSVGGTTLYSFTAYAYFWSSTVNSSSGSYHLRYYSSALYPTNRSYRRYDGWSLRCLAS